MAKPSLRLIQDIELRDPVYRFYEYTVPHEVGFGCAMGLLRHATSLRALQLTLPAVFPVEDRITDYGGEMGEEDQWRHADAIWKKRLPNASELPSDNWAKWASLQNMKIHRAVEISLVLLYPLASYDEPYYGPVRRPGQYHSSQQWLRDQAAANGWMSRDMFYDMKGRVYEMDVSMMEESHEESEEEHS